MYHRFNSLEIRFKFLISFAIIFFLSMLFCNFFIYVYVRDNIEEQIESELTNTTRMIYNMVNTSVNVSIKNHLRAVAEKNLDIVRRLYEKAKAGEISEEEAQKRAADVVLSQTIGSSGYLYCLDSQGKVTVHPSTTLSGTNVADFEFVKQMTTVRQGYLEYDWKNPEETLARPKALYMSYFEPWDWIISASAYRSEFITLVNVEDFRSSIMSLKFGESGYAYVIDKDANVIIHPVLQGVNIFEAEELPSEQMADILARKRGKAVYYWKNPGEPKIRQKLVMFDYIPEYQWIVASSSYLDELYKPLSTIRNMILSISVLFFGIMLITTIGISRTITTPLRELMARFNTVTAGDYSARMKSRFDDEVGQLTRYFNRFMDQLENTHKNLQDQIRVRHIVEQARKESQERYFLLMEAAPDPIVNYDVEGRVIYINPAFTRVFGWDLEEVTGRKMDHFVPENHWAETREMIRLVSCGDGIFNVETRRYSKQGSLVDVSISGAAAQDSQGDPAGSIIILRDITRSKDLEKQLMQAGDRERLNIGQDLHDDLCPHLIGVAGLAAVLKTDLQGRQEPSAGLAEKIGELMEDAVEKTRQLARGLCPVHLVAHGLQNALEDIVTGFAYHPGVRFECKADPDVDVLDNSRATHLFHIAREAVNNAVKHSKAGLIRISLQVENKGTASERIHLKIQDNGQGIDWNRKGNGIGLRIMEYRAKIIDAQFNMDTDARGTKIHICLDQAVQEIIPAIGG
ncbi:cache domain-containing protein [Desulfospira joergensenii]|uniref:cache domain-containing protein n=1 Tax=Desulfospira joergensenii TaxID=53329 RepID=UPI0003B6A232|nr:cache domain-containing protein [Desulfospira joergensenii]